jgi:acyl-CoA reductase-like NAD-dependent aldehyde dehydrogenase
MLKFHNLVNEHAQELAELIVQENGKNLTEALADGTFYSRWDMTVPYVYFPQPL